MRVYPIIMAGGSGTRLWPVSRDSLPKQFIALLDGGVSTFQATLRRVSGEAFEAPIVVTNEAFRFVCAEQARASGIACEIVLEPERRDSAAAVAVGALLALAKDPDAVCLVLAADHAIADTEAFVADSLAAGRLAAEGRIMTLGIRPAEPSSAYGYLEPGEALSEPGGATGDGAGDGAGRAFTLKRFVEKPDAATAASYVADGYLWNSGNFAFAARTMLEEMERFAPAVIGAARGAVAGSTRDLDFLRLEPGAFAKAPTISIDYAVMEKTKAAGVLTASFGWSDIGAWDQIFAVKPKDGAGNVTEGAVALLDTTNSLVRSQDILTAVVGLDDVVVVTTPDAVLVAAKKHAGNVKTLVARMLAEGRREAGEHLRMHRPWGWYQRIDLGARFQVKHICVHPGGTLSLQRHHHRAEHWIVVHGTAEVTVDDTVKLVHENEAAYLPIGCTHRLRNPGKIDLKLIEVQVGSYTGEDDIVRIEDVYART